MVFLSDTQDDPDRELAGRARLPSAPRRWDDPGTLGLRRSAPSTILPKSKLPCVLVDRFADERFDQIGVENQSAMRALIDHVVSFGHERIGFIAGQPGLATTRERIDAFHAALAANGLAVVCRLRLAGQRQHGERHGIGARHPVARRRRPTALVTGNNMTTIGAMRAIRERGLLDTRRSFAGRLRRFRMGRLLRAAPDLDGAALQRDRTTGGSLARRTDRAPALASRAPSALQADAACARQSCGRPA